MALPRETAGELLTRLLDGGYNDAIKTVSKSIADGSPAVNERLKELEDEVKRLAEAGETLKPSNPVFRALLAEVDEQMAANAKLIDQSGSSLIKAGVDAADEIAPNLPLTFVEGVDDYRQAVQIVAQWSKVSAEAIDQLSKLVNSPAWANELAKFKLTVPDTVLNIAVRGFTAGWNPLATAALLSKTIKALPLSYANSLMRTLYLTSYRRSTVESYKANRDVLDGYAIRVATLDNRVCMACVVLHGTRIELDEIVADHWNGRCTSVAKIKGIPINIQTGKDWFIALPPNEQEKMMGPAAYKAWQDGAIQLEQLVHEYDDPLFEKQVNTMPLTAIIGAEASAKYRNS